MMISMILLVSIPHRQTNNSVFCVISICIEEVSIPHRQTNNPKMLMRPDMTKKVSIPHRQTNNVNGRIPQSTPSSEFQFLIGRLITIQCFLGMYYKVLVSIPHRQTNNFQYLIDYVSIIIVSIPHRQTNNVQVEVILVYL